MNAPSGPRRVQFEITRDGGPRSAPGTVPGAHPGGRPRSDGATSTTDASTTTSDVPATVIRVEGELDIGNVEAFTRIIDEAFQLGPRLIVDMAGTSFIGAAGISTLVLAAKRAEMEGGSLVIRQPRPMTRKIVGILQLEDRLHVEGEGPPLGADAGDR